MWYVWHACRKEQRDILSVVIVLAILRPLDHCWLFVACSAISAMWALAWGLVCKKLYMLELQFLFSVTTLSRSTVYCTEKINSMASESILPFLSCACGPFSGSVFFFGVLFFSSQGITHNYS